MKCIVCETEDVVMDHIHRVRNPGSGKWEKTKTYKCANGHFFPGHDPAVKAQGLKD